MRLLFTLGSGSASGHCNTIETVPKPRTKVQKGKGGKSRKSSTRLDDSTMRAQGTMNSQGMSTLGTGDFRDTFEFNAKEYTQMVRARFARKPGIYREFVQIMSEVLKPDTNKVELVKRVVVLFEGHPDLIKGFSSFLPSEISIEIQSEAVIVNVKEEEEHSEDDQFENNDEDTDITRYIRNIKWTYMHQPEIYDKFNLTLQGLNRKTISEIEAVNEIAALFVGQCDLILGFNIFLPENYRILKHKTKGFLIRHPCKKGMKAHYTPINVSVEYKK